MSRPTRLLPVALRRTHHFATWLSLVMLLGASLAGVQGLVVCFGADGHVAVERVLAAECGGCDEVADVCDVADVEHDESDPHRGCECVDVSTSVLSTAAPRRAPASSLPASDALASVLRCVVSAEPRAPFAARPERAPVPHDPGRERNAVLRT